MKDFPPKRCSPSLIFALVLGFACALPGNGVASPGNGVASRDAGAAQQLSGTITDAIGRPMGRVKLELRDPTGNLIGGATTDPSGRFSVAPTNAGVYSLQATKAGFKTAVKVVRFPGRAFRRSTRDRPERIARSALSSLRTGLLQ